MHSHSSSPNRSTGADGGAAVGCAVAWTSFGSCVGASGTDPEDDEAPEVGAATGFFAVTAFVACTATWRGRRVAFCDVDARNLWEADPGTFASNLPPTLSETPIRAPFPGAKLAAAQARALPLAAGASATPLAAGASALPAAPAAAKKTSAPTTGAPSSGSVPLAPTPEPKVVKVTAQPAHGSPSAPGGDLFGDDEDCECKDGSCRLPLPPR